MFRDRDDHIEFKEVRELFVHIYNFFNNADLQSPISVERYEISNKLIVLILPLPRVLGGLQRLGVPSLVTELLHHQASPYITFAR